MNEQNQIVQEELQDVSKKNKKNSVLKIFLIIITVLLLVVASFFGGIYYSSNIKDKTKQETKEEQKNDEDNKTQKENDSKEEQEENKNDETTRPRIVGTRYEEFDNIIKNLTEEKETKSVPNYESFYLNCAHTEEPGGFGSGLPEMYFYNEDGTYLINISEYDVGNNQVVKAGTWEIKDETLILNEKYILYLVNGTIADVPVPGGSFAKGFIDYDFEVKLSDNVTMYPIKHIGISSYKESMYESDEEEKPNTPAPKPDNYQLNGKDMYSLENERNIEDFKYANMYYELIK